ncbi:hypothetical protein [Bernardetia sp.]|uniref:hypothetical protein n=1 Tax=Bernardetia sp. TaxID=1937974 RepID=UPI0025B8CC61|nr:hypothetical protein [Bernardetia sp.]
MKTLKNSDGKVFLETYLKSDSNCIYSLWNGFVNVENVKAGCLFGLELLKEHRSPYLINDNSNLEGPWQQANEWIETVWMPQALEAGLRYFAHVVSKDIFGKLSAQDLEKKTIGVLNMRLFETVEEAESWIEEVQTEQEE